ncbi:hypothetical protein V8F20_006700 [Naviculisporaceae sp. PSN 640]
MWGRNFSASSQHHNHLQVNPSGHHSTKTAASSSKFSTMPHKHTRREKDLSTFDLPPTVIAKPLPVTTISKKNAVSDKKKNDASKDKAPLKRKRGKDPKDDAPRAFERLMAFAQGKKTRSGLDDGNDRPTKKAKKAATEAANQELETAPAPKEAKKEELTIRPGERMSEFAQRVDAALPISGLVGKSKNGKDPLGFKTKRTKKERKMHKLYDEWREQEKKIQEAREEAEEEAEEKALELEAMGVNWDIMGPGKKKKGKKGSKYLGMVGGREEDPWEEIKRKRGETKVGLNEVAEAPPDLKIPRKKLVSGATVEVDDIPKAAGSLRKREELQSVREDVVASYRKLMNERREAMAKEEARETKKSKAKPSGRFRTAA